MAQSAEQIFNAMLRDAKHANHARAKFLKRSLDAAKAELAAAQKNYDTALLPFKSVRLVSLRRAKAQLADVQQDMLALIQKSGVRVMAPAAPVRSPPKSTGLVGNVRRAVTQAQSQMAAQIKAQRLDLLKAKQEVFNAQTPADKARAQQVLLDRAQRLAILVPGKRRKTSALVKVSAGVAKIEQAKAEKKVRDLQGKIAQARATLRSGGAAFPTAALLQARLQKLEIELQAAQRRLALLRKGVVRRKPPMLPPSGVRVPRPRIQMPEHEPVAPNPLTVQQGLANLIPALPKKPEESAEAYRNRLEAYLQRLIARLIALLAQGQDEASALQAATTQTLTEDKTALEAESAAGGVAADPAAEAVAEVVDGAAGPALDTIEEQVAQATAVDTAQVDELIVQAEGAEAQLAEGTTPSEYIAPSDTNATIEQAAAQEAVASGETPQSGFDQPVVRDFMLPQGVDPALISVAEPGLVAAPTDMTAASYTPPAQGTPFYKNPWVLGGVAALGAFLLWQRKK